jgi:type II secretory pathway pseudopilin PulG
MVVLIVAITVLNILVAAMLPLWSTQIRREKEEELIFRGFQYAEAIRLYHNQYEAYPTKLEQLLKNRPRRLRQLWKDPMTEDGEWQLIFEGQGDPLQGQPGQPPPGQKPPIEEDENGRDRDPQFGPREGEAVQVGPIVGVHSRSREKSMLVFDGKQRYNEWRFTVNLLSGGRPGGRVQTGEGGAITGAGPTGGGFSFSTRWIGRPWRVEFQPPMPQDGTMPGDQPGGGRGGSNRNRRQGSTKP